MSATPAYPLAVIKREALRAFAAKLSGAQSPDGLITLHAPKVDQNILTARIAPPDVPAIDEGLPVGTWTLPAETGPQKTFNLYAAREDFSTPDGRLIFTFNEAAAALDADGLWQGHDHKHYEDDAGLITSLAGNGYAGEWIIPTREMLKDVLAKAPVAAEHYWSCSVAPDHPQAPANSGNGDRRWVRRAEGGPESSFYRNNTRARLRPVRLVEIKP